MIGAGEVNKYLTIVKELGNTCKFFDAHAHPFETIFNSSDYLRNPTQDHLYSTHNAIFRPPAPKGLNLEGKLKNNPLLNTALRPEILELSLKMTYRHTGPQVFGCHMKLGGIHKALLLPVAPASGTVDNQMSAMVNMFGNDPRFLFGCSVPNTVENGHVSDFIKENTDQFKISAIKLHPNITEINLGSTHGAERAESILEACNQFNLPLIVHGGRSPILRNKKARTYGAIDNLSNIDWGISTAPVVIAHAAAYGCDLDEIERNVLPKLDRMLSTYENLMVDISGGLEVQALILVLTNLDHSKVLFGSDALYNPQWSEVVKLLFSIEKTTPNLEKTFIQIAGINASKIFPELETQ